MKIILFCILFIFLSCSSNTTSKYSNSIDNKKSKAKVILSGDLNNGICYGCN